MASSSRGSHQFVTHIRLRRRDREAWRIILVLCAFIRTFRVLKQSCWKCNLQCVYLITGTMHILMIYISYIYEYVRIQESLCVHIYTQCPIFRVDSVRLLMNWCDRQILSYCVLVCVREKRWYYVETWCLVISVEGARLNGKQEAKVIY